TPQPPGPGLPLQAPSVQTSTVLLSTTLLFTLTSLILAVRFPRFFLYCDACRVSPRQNILIAICLSACHRRLPPLSALAFALPGRLHQTHAYDSFDSRYRIDSTAYRPPAVTRMLHERPALQPLLCLAQRGITTEAAAINFQLQQFEPVFQTRNRH